MGILRRREDLPTVENVGEFTFYPISISTIPNGPFDSKFYADFEFEVKILFPPTHFREKRVLKNLRGQM